MSDPKHALEKLMVHYFQLPNEHWDLDNTAEVKVMVKLIEKMIDEKVKESILLFAEKGIEPFKPKVTPKSEEEITYERLIQEAWLMCGEPYTEGDEEWITDTNGATYIKYNYAIDKVSEGPLVAQIVEVANLMKYGDTRRKSVDEIERMKKEMEEC